MDKNAIKKYAVWARRELIARVSQKAEQYGITEKEIIDERAENIHGVVLTPAQKSQRQALIHLIQRDGYQQAMPWMMWCMKDLCPMSWLHCKTALT